VRLALLDWALPVRKLILVSWPSFGQVVAIFRLVFLYAKLARNLCGKVIRKGQKYLRAEVCKSVRQVLTGKETQRADALRGDDRDAT